MPGSRERRGRVNIICAMDQGFCSLTLQVGFLKRSGGLFWKQTTLAVIWRHKNVVTNCSLLFLLVESRAFNYILIIEHII